jgi:hypothetical protein
MYLPKQNEKDHEKPQSEYQDRDLYPELPEYKWLFPIR